MSQPEALYAAVPMKWVGPIQLSGNVVNEAVEIPLATYETPLWPSVGRGAKVSRLVEGGIRATVVREMMTRSVYFETEHAGVALRILREIEQRFAELQDVVADGSRFTRLTGVHPELTANLLYLRFQFETGDASGHNMATLASDKLMVFLLREWPELEYGSISGNLCIDKKASAINGILGRGKHVITEMTIPREIVERTLHTTPEQIAALNVRKNLIGSNLAGSIRSANAHYANMLLGFYLATGQDAANIVEGSQGITHADSVDGDLYFSCTLPNLIVGTVGNGKGLDFVEDNLTRLGCREDREPGGNARRLAALCAAGVFCGELSLLAAQTNPGELMAAHVRFERSASTTSASKEGQE